MISRPFGLLGRIFPFRWNGSAGRRSLNGEDPADCTPSMLTWPASDPVNAHSQEKHGRRQAGGKPRQETDTRLDITLDQWRAPLVDGACRSL